MLGQTLKASHPRLPYSFHLCPTRGYGDLGSYIMKMASIQKREGAWIPASPLGGEPSADPKHLFCLFCEEE